MVEKGDDKGELVYTSPECPRKRKIKARFSASFFLLMGFVLIALFSFSSAPPHVWFLVAVPIMAGLIQPITYMYPHFTIFTNGISFQSQHSHPFSRCKNIKLRRPPGGCYKGMKIMSWDKMVCFETYESTGLVGVVVHLDIWNRSRNRERLVYKCFNEKEGREAIERVISSLKEHNIKEIPRFCPNCGFEEPTVCGSCGNCGVQRFWTVKADHKPSEIYILE